MSKSSKETHFANFLAEQLNTKCVKSNKANLDFVRCHCKKELVEELLIKQSISYRMSNLIETPISGSPRFNDSILIANWQNSEIIIKADGLGVKQKKLAPNKLVRVGYNYVDHNELYQDAIIGLQKDVSLDIDTVQSCINILDAIKFNTNIVLTETLRNQQDKSKITSDFGEIALAYLRLLKQGGTILFPLVSNQTDFDFYHNNIPISAKGQKGGSRYLIAGNTAVSPLIPMLGNDHIDLMFKAWHNRETMEMLNHASYNCTELAFWRDKLGTINEQALVDYVNTNSYTQFVSDVKLCQNGNNLGVPSKDDVESNYNKGSLHPIKFALLTIWARYYVSQNVANFNRIAIMLTSNSKIVFEFFNYDVSTGAIVVTNSAINKFSSWNIVYHANAASSLNNYPALKGI